MACFTLDELSAKYLTRSGPQVVYWNADCKVNTTRTGRFSILANAHIVAIWVPPTYKVTVHEGWFFNGASKVLQPGMNKGLNKVGSKVGSMIVERIRRWEEHLVDCCSGKVSNGAIPDTCGPFWGKGGDKSASCDAIVQDYCRYKPNDRRCSCYPRKLLPGNETPLLLASKPICYDQQCNIYGFVPSTMDHSDCPNITICQTRITDLTAVNPITVTLRDCDAVQVADSVAGDPAVFTRPEDPVPTHTEREPLVKRTVDRLKRLLQEHPKLLLCLLLLVLVLLYSTRTPTETNFEQRAPTTFV